MKKISIIFSALLFIGSNSSFAQAFAGLYTFTNVTTSSGLTDPTPPPTATGLTFGSFVAYGTPANANAAGRFSFQNWPTGATNGNDLYSSLTGNLSPLEYYEVTLTPSVGYSIDLSGINFAALRSGTGIRTYSVRSSLDGFATDLSASINPNNGNLSVQPPNIFFWNFDATTTSQNGSTITLGGPQFSNLTSAITFRFYAWNSETSLGTFSIDNLTIGGTATALNILTSFTASATSVCDGTPVQFTDNTQSFNGPVTTWSWDFGDPSSGPNNTSTLQNPQHTFSTCGNYTVQLFSTNSNNNTDSASTAITVLCDPIASFSGTPLFGCGQVCLNFTDNSTGNPLAWSWSYGDLSTGNTQNPTHCYTAPGFYDVSLTVTNANGCTGSSTMTSYVIVAPPPTASFTSSTTGNVVTFTNTSTGTSPFTFQWDFGDGSPVNIFGNPSHTYFPDGTYTVCLTVTDANGCTDTTCHSVVVFTTGIPQQNINNEISVYPNPSSTGIFTLELKQNAMISVYDLVGKEIRKKEKINSGVTTLDLRNFLNGTYFIKIESENSISTKKISISK